MTSKALQDRIYDVVKTIRPGVGISNMGRKSDFFRGELNRRRRPAAARMGGTRAASRRATIVRSAVTASAIRARSRTSSTFPGATAPKPAPRRPCGSPSRLANGADPHYYVMGPLVPQDDRKALPAVRAVFDHHEEARGALSRARFGRRIGLYVSTKSRRFDPAGGKAPLNAFRGAYRALLELGLGVRPGQRGPGHKRRFRRNARALRHHRPFGKRAASPTSRSAT